MIKFSTSTSRAHTHTPTLGNATPIHHYRTHKYLTRPGSGAVNSSADPIDENPPLLPPPFNPGLCRPCPPTPGRSNVGASPNLGVVGDNDHLGSESPAEDGAAGDSGSCDMTVCRCAKSNVGNNDNPPPMAPAPSGVVGTRSDGVATRAGAEIAAEDAVTETGSSNGDDDDVMAVVSSGLNDVED